MANSLQKLTNVEISTFQGIYDRKIVDLSDAIILKYCKKSMKNIKKIILKWVLTNMPKYDTV